jgi:hypothetical protein
MRSLVARNIGTEAEIGGSPTPEQGMVTYRHYKMGNRNQSVIPYLYNIKEYDALQNQNYPMNCMIDLCSPALEEEDAPRAINFLRDHARARSENNRPLKNHNHSPRGHGSSRRTREPRNQSLHHPCRENNATRWLCPNPQQTNKNFKANQQGDNHYAVPKRHGRQLLEDP